LSIPYLRQGTYSHSHIRSTGGLVALGLGAMGWSVDECIAKFEELCNKAFTKRRGMGLPGVRLFVENFHHSKYKTGPLELALQEAFSKDGLLFGGHRTSEASTPPVKVAVTSYSLTERKPYVLSNYNRLWERRSAGKSHFPSQSFTLSRQAALT
jgi:hypothetical protein